jgi:UDP-N-acetylglucosamine--N-acetylmuramyl-(pentapeptide) pyrophosphoryl-undecaprenol N-acetylglucosamine transferase
VPFVASTTSHQRDNAIWMDKEKAAIHLPQGELNPQHLAKLLQSTDREACLKMAEAAQAVGRRDANAAIANVLEELAGKRAAA